MSKLYKWCVVNNLELNIKELIVDFRRHQEELQSLIIRGKEVERVSSFKFFGIHVGADLKWTGCCVAVVKLAPNRFPDFHRTGKSNS